jgi:hypothetical protein
MNTETNYITSIQGKIKKVYFDNSHYARILVMQDGTFYVHKITTGVFFKAKSYNDAVGIRKMIADRCVNIDRELTSNKE